MSDIEIHDEVWALCEKFGFEPTSVLRLDIYPSSVVAEVAKKNEQGSKYIDLKSGRIAIETRTFSVVIT